MRNLTLHSVDHHRVLSVVSHTISQGDSSQILSAMLRDGRFYKTKLSYTAIEAEKIKGQLDSVGYITSKSLVENWIKI